MQTSSGLIKGCAVVALILVTHVFHPRVMAGTDGAGVSPADVQYTQAEFTEFLAVSLVANQLLIARRLTDVPLKAMSFQNYLSTVFLIWASNRAMPEPILSTETVDAFLRGLAEQPEIHDKPDMLDDPLLLSSLPQEEWSQKLWMLAGFPEHLTKLYTRLLNGDYASYSKAFRESVLSHKP